MLNAFNLIQILYIFNFCKKNQFAKWYQNIFWSFVQSSQGDEEIIYLYIWFLFQYRLYFSKFCNYTSLRYVCENYMIYYWVSLLFFYFKVIICMYYLCFQRYPTDRAYFIAKEILMTERTYKKDLEILNLVSHFLHYYID